MENNKPLHQIRLGSVDWRKTRDFFGGSLQPGNFFLGHRSDVCYVPCPMPCHAPCPMPHAVPCHAAMPCLRGLGPVLGGLLGLSPMNRCKGQGP